MVGPDIEKWGELMAKGFTNNLVKVSFELPFDVAKEVISFVEKLQLQRDATKR